MMKSASEKIKVFVGIVVALGGTSTALAELFKFFDTFHNTLQNPASVWFLWLISSVFVLFGLFLCYQGLSTKSRLLKPEQLHLDPDNIKHLRGRDLDIKRLSDAVTKNSQVFLAGESGCGKSALIRTGLIPVLNDALPIDAAILPIYINTYENDWDNDLYERIVDATWRALGPKLRVELNIAARATIYDELFEKNDNEGIISSVRNSTGRIPLIIFDQFDDYVLLHSSKILKEGCWISADNLISQNRCWNSIKCEIDKKNLHILLVTRDDLVAGLEAFRFGKVEMRGLDRVQSIYIESLFDSLTNVTESNEEIIENPEAGWISLKKSLIKDLSNQQKILPIQLYVVFRALISLPYLSTYTYDQAGGLEGLEATYIEDAILSASEASNLKKSVIAQILNELVSFTYSDQPKSNSATLSHLKQKLSVDESPLTRALGILREHGLVRQHVNQVEAEIFETWALYHDYLAKPILAANKRADKYMSMLKERYQSFSAYTDWRKRWKSLLSPAELFQVLWAAIHGNANLAGFKRFTLLSTLKLWPSVLIIGVLMSGDIVTTNYQNRLHVDNFLSFIRTSGAPNEYFWSTWDPFDDLKSEVFRQLSQVALGDESLKKSLVVSMLDVTHNGKDRTTITALTRNIELIGQSTFGIDDGFHLREWALERSLDSSPDLNFRAALALYILLTNPEHFSKRALDVAHLVVNAVLQNGSITLLDNSINRFKNLVKVLPSQAAVSIGDLLTNTVIEHRNSRGRGSTIDLEDIAKLFETLKFKLPTSAIQRFAEAATLNAIEASDIDSARKAYSLAYEFRQYIPDHLFKELLANLVNIVDVSQDFRSLGLLAGILEKFKTNFSDQQLRIISASIFEDAGGKFDWKEHNHRVIKEIFIFHDDISKKRKLINNEVINEIIHGDFNLFHIVDIKEVILILYAHKTQEEKDKLAQKVLLMDLETLGKSEYGFRDSLEKSVTFFVPMLSSQSASVLIDKISERLQELTTSGVTRSEATQMQSLINISGMLAKKLNKTQSEYMVSQIVDAIRVIRPTYTRGELVPALVAYKSFISPAQIEEIVGILLESVMKTGASEGRPLSEVNTGEVTPALGLGLISEVVSPVTIRRIVTTINHSIETSKNPYYIAHLTDALGALSDKIGEEDVVTAVDRLTKAIVDEPKNPRVNSLVNSGLKFFVKSVSGVHKILPLAKSDILAENLLEALLHISNGQDFSKVAELISELEVSQNFQRFSLVTRVFQHPLVTGRNRNRLLKFFSVTSGQKFSNVDELISWYRLTPTATE